MKTTVPVSLTPLVAATRPSSGTRGDRAPPRVEEGGEAGDETVQVVGEGFNDERGEVGCVRV